jgi:hypothetical protein
MRQSSYHEREYGVGGLSVTLKNFLDFPARVNDFETGAHGI